jgi:hypothetical protein
MIAILKLLIPVLGLGFFILIPALMEWRKPSDVAALKIDQGFSRDDLHFARRFRVIASDWWLGDRGAILAESDRLPDASKFDAPFLAERLVAGRGCRFASELWTRGQTHLGEGSEARAILCEGTLTLEPHCQVQRWTHAEERLTATGDCFLGARATSAGTITLGPGSKSNLFSAPEIRWKTEPVIFPMPLEPWIQRWSLLEDQLQSEAPDGTVFVDGDVVIEDNAHIDFPLVVRGNVYIRHGALLAANIKAHGDLVLEHATVLGNLISMKRLVVGDSSTVQGCLHGEDLVWLGDGVTLGRPGRLVAVVGDRVELTGSGTLHGRVKALADVVEVLG